MGILAYFFNTKPNNVIPEQPNKVPVRTFVPSSSNDRARRAVQRLRDELGDDLQVLRYAANSLHNEYWHAVAERDGDRCYCIVFGFELAAAVRGTLPEDYKPNPRMITEKKETKEHIVHALAVTNPYTHIGPYGVYGVHKVETESNADVRTD